MPAKKAIVARKKAAPKNPAMRDFVQKEEIHQQKRDFMEDLLKERAEKKAAIARALKSNQYSSDEECYYVAGECEGCSKEEACRAQAEEENPSFQLPEVECVNCDLLEGEIRQLKRNLEDSLSPRQEKELRDEAQEKLNLACLIIEKYRAYALAIRNEKRARKQVKATRRDLLSRTDSIVGFIQENYKFPKTPKHPGIDKESSDMLDAVEQELYLKDLEKRFQGGGL